MVKWLCLAMALLACSADEEASRPGGRGMPANQSMSGTGGSTCIEGARRSCACGAETGYATCRAGELSECVCAMPSTMMDASRPLTRLDHCEPGTYRGNYSCTYMSGMSGDPMVVEGAVQFALEVDETLVRNEDCDEFCSDLVISEGSGQLYGFAGLFIGFQCSLQGGLDCTTGEFRANAVDGEYGLPTPSDPADPMSPATVAQPPWGTFDGTLEGMHNGEMVQVIAGEWALMEMQQGGTCIGPFNVERM